MGVYNLVLPISVLALVPLAVGVYTLRVYNLVLPISDLELYMLFLKNSYKGPFKPSLFMEWHTQNCGEAETTIISRNQPPSRIDMMIAALRLPLLEDCGINIEVILLSSPTCKADATMTDVSLCSMRLLHTALNVLKLWPDFITHMNPV